MFLGGRQDLVLWLSCLSLVFIVVKSSELSDSGGKNTVVLLFQDVTLSDWNAGNKTALLQKITVDAINVFCSHNASRCSLNFWDDSRKFNIQHVVVIESPKQEEKDVLVKLFVSLPDGSDIQKDDHTVIPGAILQEILQAHMHNITFAVSAVVKSINMNSDSKENKTPDNKMNYIMIPISFTVLVVLCFVACCLHCASKSRQKAIDIERRKQALRKLRRKPSATDTNEGHVPTQNTGGENVSITVIHEDARKKRRKKHKTEEGPNVNNEQQEQFENDESRELRIKRKKKVKHNKLQRLEGHASLETGDQWEDGERERVPTPMPVHRELSTRTEAGASFEGEPRGRKHRKKKKQRKSHREIRENDEGFDEESETRQAGNSEDSLIKSLPRPRQLVPLQERSPAALTPAYAALTL